VQKSVIYATSANNKVFTAFLDTFDKVLHNGLFVKILCRNVLICFVTLFMLWQTSACPA